MCKEPDNLSSVLVKHYSSLPELDVEEQLLFAKVALMSNKGRIKRGQGDNSIGAKVPRMMTKLGLREIDIRLNDRVAYLEPPYEGRLQQHTLAHVKKHWLDTKRRETWLDRERKEFLAGGGDPQDYQHYREIADRAISIFRQQIEAGEYFSCSFGDFYIIKGKKSK